MKAKVEMVRVTRKTIKKRFRLWPPAIVKEEIEYDEKVLPEEVCNHIWQYRFERILFSGYRLGSAN